MKLSPRYSLYHVALLAAGISVAMPAVAAVDLNKRLSVKQDPTEIVMGQVMYDYHLGNGFTALNAILTNKAEGRLSDGITETEILLGDIYTEFGMPDAADNIFSRIITRDMRSATRNETWFRQGRLKYRQGNYFEAERFLNVPVDTKAISASEAERRVMLATVLMAKNEFDRARELLSPVPLNTSLGMYATYNMGVAHLRANQYAEGIQLLETVMNLPVSDNETNALKDRAALAMGYSHLQAKNTDKARDALLNIRLEGPFSNQAMLALGYVHFLREDFKRALSFWLELATRNPADRSVQEAMLLTPRAYEALQANQQAFQGYQTAAQTLRNQMGVLDRISTTVKTREWLDNLSPDALGEPGSDPLNIHSAAVPANREETAFLFHLFASHSFHEGYTQYLQLRRLQELMKGKVYELKAMSEVADRLVRRQASLPAQLRQVDTLEQQMQTINDRWDRLQRKARQANRQSNSAASPLTPQQIQRHLRIEALKSKVNRLADSGSGKQAKDRVKLLGGLHLFDIASSAPLSRKQLEQELLQMSNEVRLAQTRIEALRQLADDNKRTSTSNPVVRTADLVSRISLNQKALEKSLEEHRNYLRELAEAMLEDTRHNLNRDIADAHLNIARLQDATLLREPPVSSGKPQP